MIWLLLCILISVAILGLFKSFSKFGIHRDNAIVISYFTSFILSFFTREKGVDLKLLPDYQWFYLALLIGFTFYIGFQLFAQSTHKIGMAITSVSGNTCVVVPVAIAILFYSEAFTIAKIIGISLVVLSFILIFKKEKSKSIDWHFIYLPILLFMFNGINASLMGYGENIGVINSKINFMMLIFFSAFIVGLVKSVFSRKKERITIKTIIASILLGGLNFASTIMILKSLDIMPDSIFFPVYNSGYIVLSALFGYWAFKEKLMIINWIGISIALTGIIILTSGL